MLNHKPKIERDKDLFPYLTIRVHTKAEFFYEAKTRNDLIWAKIYVNRKNIPLFILGGGSNLVPLKERISGLVVLNRYLKKEVINENKNYIELLISSGYPVSKLVGETINNGWGGFEYHLGLPGTVGGAIYMNSKWTKPLNYFGQNLVYAFLVDQNGKVKKVSKKYFQFNYDFSILQKTKEIVLEGVFKLKKTNSEILNQRAQLALNYRRKTQPFGVATAGCFFKNVNNISAGYLIDKTGLKGFSFGGWVVSDLHANFIINKGNGSPDDLRRLVDTIKKKVKEKFNIELKEEVIFDINQNTNKKNR